MGLILLTADGWTVDTTKASVLGMTAHWIESTWIEKKPGDPKSKVERWELKAAVIGFKATAGGHEGENMGRYMMGLTDRVGITGTKHTKVRLFPMHSPHHDQQSQLFCVTMDNTNVNGTSCETIELVHEHRGLSWTASTCQVP